MIEAQFGNGSGRDIRAAVALNNIGVSLLERSAFRDAVETFRDCICIMKAQARQMVHPQDTLHESNALDIDNIVGRAGRALAASSRGNEATGSMEAAQLEVTSLDEGDAFTACLPLQDKNSSLRVYPFRIESFSLNDGIGCVEDSNFYYEFCVAMYNFALAHLCLHKTSRTASRSRKILEGALKILNVNKTALSRYWSGCTHMFEQGRMLMLSCHVLRAIIEVQVSKGQHEEAQAEEEALFELLTILNDENSFGLFWEQRNSIASAA